MSRDCRIFTYDVGHTAQVTSVQIVACDMKPVYRKIRVDGSTGLPVEEDETAALELNDMWSVWSGVITPQDPLQQTVR